MKTQHIGITEFLISCLVILFLILIAGIWAYGAYLEHYA